MIPFQRLAKKKNFETFWVFKYIVQKFEQILNIWLFSSLNEEFELLIRFECKKTCENFIIYKFAQISEFRSCRL